MRVAFTIILNGKHHLLHNNYYQFLLDNFDMWVVVEGVALNTGSTSWCKSLDTSFHTNGLSNDGTTEFLNNLNSDKIKIIKNNNGFWSNKDEQVNAAISYIKTQTDSCYLWQIDIDEQWTSEQLSSAEKTIDEHKAKTGCFLCNFYVGKNHLVTGEWGEGRYLPYRRLWKWEGEMFKTHEPPILEGKNSPEILIPIKFNHYSYYFEQDVKFKESYYTGYENLYKRWLDIQQKPYNMHVRELLGTNTWWSQTNSLIQYVN